MLTDRNHVSTLAALVADQAYDPRHWENALRYEFASIKAHAIEHGRYPPDHGRNTVLYPTFFKPNATLQLILDVFRESATNAYAPNYASRITTYSDKLGDFPASWASYINLNYFGMDAAAGTARAFPNIESRHWRTRTRHIQSVLLVALQRYQLDHDRLPESLADLSPDYLAVLLRPLRRQPPQIRPCSPPDLVRR